MGEQLATWERLAQQGDMEEAVLSYVGQYGPTTFARLDVAFAPYFNTAGSLALGAGPPNVWFWNGMSEPWITVIVALFQERRLHIQPADVSDYARDGRVLDWPAPELINDLGYRTPHWLPVRVCLENEVKPATRAVVA